MPNQHITIASIIIIIVLIIIASNYQTVSKCEKFLTGMWVASKEFCDTAGISDMRLYIGENTAGPVKVVRSCYLLVVGACSQLVDVKYTRPLISSSMKKYTIRPQIEYTDDPLWGDSVWFELDVLASCLKIYEKSEEVESGKTEPILCGLLYKDGEITDMFAVEKENSKKE